MIIKYYNDEDIVNRLLTLFEEINKEDKIFSIMQILEYLQNNNWSPNPPYTKPLKWYENELFEIKIKFWSDLYRINYFIDKDNDFMIILNWYYKPDGRNSSDNYNKSKKNKLDKKIAEKNEWGFENERKLFFKYMKIWALRVKIYQDW